MATKSKAVLLLSSGLDSAANLAIASEKFEVKVALTIHYGQKGAQRELRQAAALASYFQVEHVIFDLSHFALFAGGNSALINQQHAIPSLQQTKLDDASTTKKSASAVWVPNRNGVLLNLAAALAESRGLDAVAVGFNAEEAVTFPDNTPDFMSAMTQAFSFSTANHVKVVSATASMNKQQIVENLAQQEFPFELIWSCYEAGQNHCGQCESCQRLKRAVTRGVTLEKKRQEILNALFGDQWKVNPQ